MLLPSRSPTIRDRPNRTTRGIQLLAVAFCLTIELAYGSERGVEFEKDVAPILVRRCLECHQGERPSGGLDLTSNAAFLRGGDSGPVFTAKSPPSSPLLERVRADEMPPEKQGRPQPLPPAEKQVLANWLAQGAAWPQGRTLDWFEATMDTRAGRDWWSLQPIRRPSPPVIAAALHPIDAFVRRRLQHVSPAAPASTKAETNHDERLLAWEPAPRASRRVQLTRLSYVLTGLPPTREQIEAFEADRSAAAWERQIDNLLASPHFGERWARHWLDLVRYADTSGYERDQEKPFAWKYRDWVVDAFNRDMPYDTFLTHQLAGDQIPTPNRQSLIATGFLRLGTWNDEPNDPADYEYDRLEDLVHVTSTAFLGLTVKCARCHAHKFDPVTQDDYYRLGSIFWSGPIAPRDRSLLGGPTSGELNATDVLGWTDVQRPPRPLRLLRNGERSQPLHEVKPATLSCIPSLYQPLLTHAEQADDAKAGDRTTGERAGGLRLQMARWMTDPRHPLPARVMVNRIWQHHFGEGIVRTPNNFGFLADPPTHPELLDWLASELIDNGWSLKRIHRLILTSETWRQSSLHPHWKDYEAIDAGNRLLWRANRRRLDAESLRDKMLSVSDQLDLTLGGPSFRPTISPEALDGLSKKSSAWTPSPSNSQKKRSIYAYMKRGLLPPLMTTFDLCDSSQPCGQRESTTVPTQALTLLNNDFVHQQSRQIARWILKKASQPGSHPIHTQITATWNAIHGRDATSYELAAAQRHIEHQRALFQPTRSDPAASGTRVSHKLRLHLRADEGMEMTDMGGKLHRWRDLSGNRHHATQAMGELQPTRVANAAHGRPAVVFDGKDDFLKIDGRVLNSKTCVIFAVISDEAKSGHREIISNWNGSASNSTSSVFLGVTGRATVRFTDHFRPQQLLTTPSEIFLLTAISGPNGTHAFQNGRLLGSGPPLPERNLTTNWVLGQQGNIQGEYWNGRLAEIQVYEGAISPPDRSQIECALGEKYGITITPTFASEAGVEEPLSPHGLALASLAHVLLNSNEFVYID